MSEIENKIVNREEVIKTEGLGVSFNSGYKKDDYKSKTISFLRNKNKKKENKLTWPLRDINLVAYKGEVLGIIGSNGSGKTTLCKVITGILQPDEGSINVKGKVSTLFSMGMGFNKDLTGRENVYLNGMMLGIDKVKIDLFFDEIHEFSGIGEFMEQPMKKYSSGMKARLGFSVAAHLDPEILILDEALNTGDAAFSKKAAIKIKELVQRAKIVIIVTHSHKYALENCDRLVWLEQGSIMSIGDPENIVKEYEATIPKKTAKPQRKLDLKKTNADIKDSVVINAENVSVEYKIKKRKFKALDNLNFTINEGEVVGIIGHNGAGKSTLCKTLTQIISPDHGVLTVNGETTALLSYGTGFNAQLNGTDNIYLNGMLLGIPIDVVKRNYENIVEFSELGKFINKPIKHYSSGMRARLGFSIAAILQPDIFIIDEALSTGDMAFRQKASEKIQGMMEQAKAVIIVSHSLGFVEKVCTRAILIEKGKIIADGESKEVVKAYRDKINDKKK
ncbi:MULTISPECIES: ABC transporter ATP-binding protein [Paraliobacillus]|uniref:ABC transporter ATP-binding protein n=1 Tax=Paraliobacillus TaxID=200903 RepID=UPI000DD39369|nr:MULTISPECIES: ABC transporter ATP-binding protein [Paraliobacillus]